MKKTIRDYELKGKKVLIRCDFNVPMEDGIITDDNRLRASLETINYAIDQGAKLILFSHLGRIKEEADLAKNNLKPIADALAKLLNREIIFIDETRGTKLENAIEDMKEQEIILVQNTRYEDLEDKKESGNSQELGAYWASLGDLFINDAFGTAHRGHASNLGISSHLPSGIGFLIEKELKELSALQNPPRPFTVIMGGAKVTDKIPIIDKLIDKADQMIIAGGMAYTFLKAQGLNIGESILDEDSIDYAKELMAKYPDKLHLPIDFHVATDFSNEAKNRFCDADQIADNEQGLDIGPKSAEKFIEVIRPSKTVFWNGPVGVFEFDNYTEGTRALLEEVIKVEYSVLGGGDSVAAATKLNYKDKVSHASTGGGATLEYMEGKELPGIASISNK